MKMGDVSQAGAAGILGVSGGRRGGGEQAVAPHGVVPQVSLAA